MSGWRTLTNEILARDNKYLEENIRFGKDVETAERVSDIISSEDPDFIFV